MMRMYIIFSNKGDGSNLTVKVISRITCQEKQNGELFKLNETKRLKTI